MDQQDLLAIAFFLACPLLLTAIGLGALFGIRWQQTTHCLNCGRRVPTTALCDDDVHRARCEDLMPSRGRPQDREPSCRHCHTPLFYADAIRLWDGHDYCQRCVAAAHPDLPRYAREHERLEETMPHSAWRVARNMFLLGEAGVLGTFGVMFVIAGVNLWGGLWGGLAGLFIAQLFALIPVVPKTIGYAVGFALARPSVSVCGGTLAVWGGDMAYGEEELGDCQWFIGSVNNAYFLLGGEAVILTLPRRSDRQRGYIAVGFTPETRAIWEAFLTLAGLKRRRSWENQGGVLRTTLQVLGIILVLALGVGLSVGLMFAAQPVLFAMTGDDDIARMVSVVFFIPGFLYILSYLSLGAARIVGIKSDDGPLTDEQNDLRKRVTQVALLVTCLALVPVFLFMTEVSLRARLIAIGASLLAALVLGNDLGKRFARLMSDDEDEE